jgi:hypothetical protein
MTCDINRPYRRSVVDLWEEEIFRDIVEVWFFLFVWLLEDKVVLNFGGFVLFGRVGFSLKIYEINKVT